MPQGIVADRVFESVLNRLMSRGILSSREAMNARLLREAGLHPEQVLIGTGVVVPEDYGEALSDVYDLPFARLADQTAMDPAWKEDDVWEEQSAFPLSREGRSLAVGYVEPDEPHRRAVEAWMRRHGFKSFPHVILASDFRGAIGSPSTAWRAARQLLRELVSSAEARDARHVHLTSRGLEGSAHFGDDPSSAASLSISPGLVPALVRVLSRDTAADWRIEHTPTLGGFHAVLFSADDADETDGIRSFLEEPRGLLVLVDPDASTRSRIDRIPNLTDDQWREADDRLRRTRIGTPEDWEGPLHAALAGRPIVAVTDTMRDEPWRSAVEAGIPCQVIRRHRTPEGSSWERLQY